MPFAGSVTGSRKAPELPKFVFAIRTELSGFSTETRAELSALPVIVTPESLSDTRCPVVPANWKLPFVPGVGIESGTAAPPGVVLPPFASFATVQSATVALPL